MIRRVQYAKPWLVRYPAEVTGQFQHKPSKNKYKPHQGRKEMARRRKQLGLEEVIIYKPI
jgi:hypothetical protein